MQTMMKDYIIVVFYNDVEDYNPNSILILTGVHPVQV